MLHNEYALGALESQNPTEDHDSSAVEDWITTTTQALGKLAGLGQIDETTASQCRTALEAELIAVEEIDKSGAI